MKRTILFSILAVSLSITSYGQITSESYEKSIDILNYQSVYYSLSVLSPTKGVTAKFKSNCNCENNPTYEKIKSSIPGTELKTIEISKEIQELKNQDPSALNKGSTLEYLIDNVFNKSLALNAFKNDLEQQGKFLDYRENIRRKLEGVLVENNQKITSDKIEAADEQSNLEDRILSLEKNQISQENNTGLFGGLSDYLIIVAIFLGILGVILALRDNYKTLMPKILDSERLREFVLSINNFNRNTGSNNSNTFEIRDLHNRIGDLDLQISKLNNQIQKLTESNQIKPAPLPYQEDIQPEPKTETLFLSTPNSDGSFNESSASNTYRDGASIYRLTKTDSVNAKFKIDEKETSIKLALQYPDKNIDPVCDAENAFNPRANRISTIKLGEAELQNGKWIINSKAVIRYED